MAYERLNRAVYRFLHALEYINISTTRWNDIYCVVSTHWIRNFHKKF